MGTKSKNFSLFLVVFLVASSLLIIQLASAQSTSKPSVPENPDTNQPIITIDNLKNGSTLTISYLAFSFKVQKPFSWFNFYPVHGDLISISYFLDEEITEVASKGLDSDHYSSKPLTYSETISGLSEGNHSLRVYVRSVSYYLDPNRPAENSTYGWWIYPAANYYMDTNSNINFIVDTTPDISTPTPTPTPTVPELSWLMVVPLLLSMLSVAMILRHRKTISQNKPNVKEKSIN